MSNRLARLFTVIALGALATIGLWEGARGVIVPHFLADLHLSAAAGGAVFAASSLGYLANSLSFGYFSHRFGLKRLVMAGLGLMAVALSVFLTQRNPAVLYAGNMLLGAATSMMELSTSIQISLIYRDKQSGMLNLLHGCFGAGALSGSLWAAFWLGLGASWRVPFGLVGAILTLWALWYLTLPVAPLPRDEEGEAGYGPLLRDPLVWVAALTLCAAVAGEAGFTLWLPYYLQKAKGLGEAASAGYMTAFFAGFTGTRLAGSWVVERVGQVRSVVGLAVVGLVSLLALMLLPAVSVWMPVLAGAGIAVVFATCTALLSMRYPERVNQVYTVTYSAGGLAGIFTGPLMGWLTDRVGAAVSMAVPLTAYVLVILLMTWYGLAGRSNRSVPEKA